MPKEEASKLVMRAIAGRSEQAGACVGQAGVADPEDLWNWTKANKAGARQQALHGHMRDGRISSWDGLTASYLKDLDKRNPELAMKAYPHSRYDAASKTVIVQTQAGETSWGAAIRSGLIGKR
jgi:hypothetical protein